jgi:hypothetical protein
LNATQIQISKLRVSGITITIGVALKQLLLLV